ncbi:nucleotidyltransferase family protein [Aurantivibrio infirmus]
MKAMIFAAGRGERMGELTQSLPKPMLEVRGKPLIVHTLKRLRDANISDVIINIAYLGDAIKNYLGDGEQFGVAIQYSEEPYPLETAGAILHALPLLGDESFVAVNADVWTDFSFDSLVNKSLGKNTLGHLVMVPNPEQHPQGDFCLDADNKLFLRSGQGTQSFTFSGISLFSPKLIRDYEKKREKFPLLEVFVEAMKEKQLSGEIYNGEWEDIGTPERLEAINRRQLFNGT